MELKITDGVALLRMNAGKANAINPEFLRRLDGCLDEFDESGARGLVMTGYERFFSAGLDLATLRDFDRDQMRLTMEAFETTMLRVFTHPRPVVAAINGHAIAGGCVLALQADERILNDGNFKMGLNEVALGVGLPAVVIEVLRRRLPPSSLLPVALEGSLCSPAEALNLGLVDALAPPEEVEPRALERAHRLATIAPHAYAQVKRSQAMPVLERVAIQRKARAEEWLDTWFAAETRELVTQAIAQLEK